MSRDAKPSKATKPAKPKTASLGWFGRLKLFSFRRAPASPPPLLKDVVERPPGTRRKAPSAVDADATRMLAALKVVLDRHAAARSVLVHLRLVEQALQQRGLAGLQDVPTDVLHRALSQLETLVSDWSQGHLAALRAQLKSAMARPGRVAKPPRDGAAARHADFGESRVQVNEASVSTFMEARARWDQSLTGGR